MRRLLKEIPGGDVKGDTTTLEDFSMIAKLRADQEQVTRPTRRCRQPAVSQAE